MAKVPFKNILGLALFIGVIGAIFALMGTVGYFATGDGDEALLFIVIWFCVGFFGTIIVELFLNMLRED